MIKAPHSLDTELSELLKDVDSGKIQLPEFQRDWTWDDNRIRGILASLSMGYPMGAIMKLQYGNSDIKFMFRPITGVKNTNENPDSLVLDGQQRLTSMYQSTYSKDAVKTKTEKGKNISRYYYLDINKCLDQNEDRFDAIISVPEDKIIRKNAGHTIELDLSNQTKEFENEMFPINILFDLNSREDWGDGYKEHYNNDKDFKAKYNTFRGEVLDTITTYKLPVITLDRDTPREAVCKVFENVNTGGVPLTIFELVTATYATYKFDLRKDWNENCKPAIWRTNEQLKTDLLQGVNETTFLTAVTLYTNYCKFKKGKGIITCKKKDILALSYEDYIENRQSVIEGFRLVYDFLINQYIFREKDLPYMGQIIPLAVICAYIKKSTFNKPEVQSIIEKWFWNGLLGEMYGGMLDTRYTYDVEDVINEIEGQKSENRTLNSAFFSSSRLLSMQTRQSASYKGIMALIYKNQAKDFIKGNPMNLVTSVDGNPDIHHIFPEDYCKKQNYDRNKWNSIVNKTPILAETNRSIGGIAPSQYCKKIIEKGQTSLDNLKTNIESNFVNYDYLVKDDFDSYFIDRAKKILHLVENAMDKEVSDKDSELTINLFGTSLN